jgi:hypothetical protein
MMNKLRKWWHSLIYRSHRTLLASWTWHDKHYFVVDGALYLMQTQGSDKPYEWVWTLVTYL